MSSSTSVYHRGRRAYDEMTRPHGRVDPFELSEQRLLEILDVNPHGAESLVERGDGSIFNLLGLDTRDLEILPGVGKASLARLLAIFAFIDRYERWRQAGNEPAADPQEVPSVTRESQGDVA